MGPRLTAVVVVALGIALTGCGSSTAEFPPAAEPAVSPPATTPPAGRLVKVGSDPEGLVVDARTGIAATITRDPSALTLVDLDDGRVLRRVSLPSTGRHLGLAAPGGPVLVPAEQSDELIEVSLPSGTDRAIAVGDHPHDAAAAAGRVFVGNEFGDTISVIEKAGVAHTLAAPVQPGGVAAAGERVAVVAVAERVLAVYDAKTLARLGVAPAGEGPTHVVTDGRRAWVADTDGDSILCFSIAAGPRLLSTTPTEGSPYAIALDPRRDRLWVGLNDRNRLVSYDVSGDRPRRLRDYPTARQVNSIAVDERTGGAVLAARDADALELIGGRRR